MDLLPLKETMKQLLERIAHMCKDQTLQKNETCK